MQLSVTLVAHQLHERGGMERALCELIRHAHDRVDFTVVATVVEPDLRPLVRWLRVPVPTRPVPLFFGAFAAAAGVRTRDRTTDLVHAMGALIPNVVDVASVQFCHAAFQRLPAEITRASGGAMRQLNRRLDRGLSLAAERHAYRRGRVQMLLPASSGVERELRHHYPGIATRVVSNGVDTERFRPDRAVRRAERERLNLKDADVVAVFVGGDWPRKGLDVAIRALGHARRAGGSDLRLVIVGHGDQEAYRQLAKEADVADRVTFAGRVLEPERVLAAADLMVFPTSYEAFPLAALEGAASALPIVASVVNGIEDLIAEGESGYIVSREPKSYSEAMLRLSADAELRNRMGAASRARARRFSWQSIADATVEVYERLDKAAVRP